MAGSANALDASAAAGASSAIAEEVMKDSFDGLRPGRNEVFGPARASDQTEADLRLASLGTTNCARIEVGSTSPQPRGR